MNHVKFIIGAGVCMARGPAHAEPAAPVLPSQDLSLAPRPEGTQGRGLLSLSTGANWIIHYPNGTREHLSSGCDKVPDNFTAANLTEGDPARLLIECKGTKSPKPGEVGCFSGNRYELPGFILEDEGGAAWMEAPNCGSAVVYGDGRRFNSSDLPDCPSVTAQLETGELGRISTSPAISVPKIEKLPCDLSPTPVRSSNPTLPITDAPTRAPSKQDSPSVAANHTRSYSAGDAQLGNPVTAALQAMGLGAAAAALVGV